MALSTGQKFSLGGGVLMLAAAAYLYYAYTKGMYPFTPALKAKIQKMLGLAPSAGTPLTPPIAPIPQTSLPAGTDVSGLLTPPAGTGAVPLGSDMLNPYQPKQDPTINTIFQQELYKQLFMPYNQYPYLYDQNYRQGLVPPTNPNDPLSAAATVFGYRPAIQGGDVPASILQNQQDQQQLQQTLYEQYGLFPPGGGGATGPDSQYFQPGQTAGLPSNMDCMTDPSGQQWCVSPSQTSLQCQKINNQWYCPIAPPITDQPNPTPNMDCFDYQSRTFCKATNQNSTGDCMTVEGKIYCPTTPSPDDTTPNCFVQAGETLCESPSKTSQHCVFAHDKWYCPLPPVVQDCFVDNTGRKFCVATTPVDPGCYSISGKWYCPDPATPAATIPPVEDDTTRPPPGDPCFGVSGVPYCYSSTKLSDACISVGGYYYCPYVAPGVPAPPGPVPVPQPQPQPSPTPGYCAPQYCGPGGEWDYTYCRCVPASTPAPTPTPTPTPTPVPVPVPPPSRCNSSKCSSQYNGRCNTECQNRNSSECNDCIAVCCNYAGVAHIPQQRRQYIRDKYDARNQIGIRAREVREQALAELEAERMLRNPIKKPVQASLRDMYSYDVIYA